MELLCAVVKVFQCGGSQWGTFDGVAINVINSRGKCK